MSTINRMRVPYRVSKQLLLKEGNTWVGTWNRDRIRIIEQNEKGKQQGGRRLQLLSRKLSFPSPDDDAPLSSSSWATYVAG